MRVGIKYFSFSQRHRVDLETPSMADALEDET